MLTEKEKRLLALFRLLHALEQDKVLDLVRDRAHK
jgi:hypothetical protein